MKLKMADARKRLYNFISQIQPFDLVDQQNRDSTCVGKTVKEMTVYFENMSKSSNIENIDPKTLKKQLTINQSSIPMFRNSTNLCNGPKIPTLKNRNSLKKDLNLHSVWKDSKLYSKSIYRSEVSRSNLMETIKNTLKSSLLNCMLVLQYIR